MVAEAGAERITEGTLKTVDGHRLPLEATSIQARIRGPIATVTVEQRFRNTRSENIEAVYSFPLPADASVEHMEFRIGERVVRGVVKGRAEARKAYERARQQGRSATLLEQDRPSLFTLSVANVRPGETILVSLRYQEILRFDDGQWRFVFPLTAPARYAPSPLAEGAPLRPTGTRSGDVSAEIRISDVAEISELRCGSHTLSSSEQGSTKILTLSAGEEIPNRDLVVTWKAARAGVRPAVHFESREGKLGTLLLLLTPPEHAEKTPEAAGNMKALSCGNCGGPVNNVASITQIPGLGPVFPCGFCGAILAPSNEGRIAKSSRARDVLVLVDRSASMRGSNVSVRKAVRALVSSLDPGDAVQVIAFDHDRSPLNGDGSGFATVSPELVTQIDAFLSGQVPRGGTELDRVLEAIGKSKPREGSSRPVVLLTDATVGNEGRLLRQIGELFPHGQGRRLFVLGIGERLDRSFIDRLARAGGGAADTLSPGEDEEAVFARLVRRVRDGGPILTGLSLSFEGCSPEDLCPAALPDLFGGQPVTLLARAASIGTGKIVLTAATADGRPFRQELVLSPPAEETEGLTRLWAKRRIDTLLSTEGGDLTKIEPAVTALALEHGIVTPYTSLVAEDTEAPKEPAEPPVRVDIPKGGENIPVNAARASDDDELTLEATLEEAEESWFTPPTGEGAPMRESAPMLAKSLTADSSRMLSPEPASAASYERARTVSAPAGIAPAPARMPAPAPHPAAPRSMVEPAPAELPKRTSLLGAVGAIASGIGRLFGGGGSPGPEDTPIPPELPTPSPPVTASAPQQPSPSLESSASEPYPEGELSFIATHTSGELDLVFLVDETGSMGSYIGQVKAHLTALIEVLSKSPLCKSLRIGIVTYRDHPPQDASYASRVVPLSTDLAMIRTEVDRLQASGGGDGPESVTDGLFELPRLQWRPRAAKTVVWFGDAPPHGVVPDGDGFPQGCPCGNHWYTQAESCREMGITVHAVGCVPAIRAYVGAEEVFRIVAKASRGLYVPLSDAALLVPVVVGAAYTELDKQRIDERLGALLLENQEALASTDLEERVRWLTERLAKAGVQPRSLAYDPDLRTPSPMRFRPITAEDVAESLDRIALRALA